MGKSTGVLLAGAVVVVVAAMGAFLLLGCVTLSERKLDLPRFSYEERIGSVFLPPPDNPFKAPEVRELGPPSFPDATAVWGATGRDRRGHIWVGVSARSSGMSAHLLEYDPDMDIWHDRGSVLEQLKAGGLYRSGEGQIKIHSKIVPADDGRLYFASTDEDGEDPGSMMPPRWGGHLWRIGLEDYRWEHLMAVPEGLVAVSGVGRYVYALGYWGHVLYGYDTLTGALKRVIVGSVGGHVSRNFLAEVGGHAFVPRVSGQAGAQFTAALVEYDNELREVAATPLEFYLGKGAPDLNHGVVGIAYLADGRLLLTTHIGQLYQIEPQAGAPAKVSALGWFHPDGEAYAPSLFSFSGNDLLAGVTHRNNRYEWVVFDLKSRVSAAFPLDTKGLRDVLLYGSISRDNAGRFYVAGWARNEGGSLRPLVLQINAGP